MKYSKHIDYLMACVVYLGTQPDWWARTPTAMANELSLEKAKLERVLNSFRGLFRKSGPPSENGEHFYSLQARYALRTNFGTAEDRVDIPALGTAEIRLIYDFMQKAADDEKLSRRAAWGFAITAIAAMLSAGAAIYAAATKVPPASEALAPLPQREDARASVRNFPVAP